MNHMGLKSAADARALGRHAVDLALQPGVSGLDGLSFSKITSAFAKLGQGVENNVGILSTVGGAVLTATGVGAPAGIALATAGNAAQGAVSAKAEAKAAKKKAKADAAAAAAAAAGQDPAAAAAAVYAEDDDAPKKSSVLKWVAAGGGGLILLGTVAWALLRRKG
jgi:hypothetical protein